jgi:hypothetical protein
MGEMVNWYKRTSPIRAYLNGSWMYRIAVIGLDQDSCFTPSRMQVRLDACKRRFGCGRMEVHHDCVAGREPWQGKAKGLAGKPLEPIAHHGAAHFASYRDTQARRLVRFFARQHEHRGRTRAIPPAVGVYLQIIGSPREAVFASEEVALAWRLGHGCRRLARPLLTGRFRVARGQAMTALCATALQHRAPCGRRHPLAETVFVAALAHAGLERAFHLLSR